MRLSSQYHTTVSRVAQLRAESASALAIELYLTQQGYYHIIVGADFAEGVFAGVLYGF